MGKGHRVEVLVDTDDVNKLYYVEDRYFINITAYREAMVNILQLYEIAKEKGYRVIVRENTNSVDDEKLVDAESKGMKR